MDLFRLEFNVTSTLAFFLEDLMDKRLHGPVFLLLGLKKIINIDLLKF